MFEFDFTQPLDLHTVIETSGTIPLLIPGQGYRYVIAMLSRYDWIVSQLWIEAKNNVITTQYMSHISVETRVKGIDLDDLKNNADVIQII